MQFWGDRPGFRLLVCHHLTSCLGEAILPRGLQCLHEVGAVAGRVACASEREQVRGGRMTPSPLAPSRTSPPHPLKPKLSSQEQSRSMGSCPRDCRRLCPRVVGMQRCRTGRGGGGRRRGAGPGQDAGPGEGQSQPGPPLEPWHISHTQSFPLWGKGAGLECRPCRGMETRIALAVCAGTWV